MTDTPADPDPEAHNAAEDLDQDRLRLDPLEEGMDPPEHWSPAVEQGITERDEREGRPLDDRLREEQPEAGTPREPRDEVDRMDAEGELSGRPADDEGEVPFARDVEDPPAEARGVPPSDEGAQSVARELRTPRDRAR